MSTYIPTDEYKLSAGTYSNNVHKWITTRIPSVEEGFVKALVHGACARVKFLNSSNVVVY